SLIELESGDVLFVGDTHGDFRSTVSVVERARVGGYERLVFLGDYVDRGPQQIENMNYVLALKIHDPDFVVLLRGNHETPEANAYYGFYATVCTTLSRRLYGLYSRLFSQLPFAALLSDGVLALHGGIAKGLSSVRQLSRLPKGQVSVRDPMAFQVLWNDPRDHVRGFQPSWRGPGIYYFGSDAFERFAERNRIRMLVRAHEVFREGYRLYFGGKVLSVFSAAYYGFPIDAKVAAHERDGRVRVIPI
ncbi:TPA: serine/threonine protein phosphatase, partial [Candidatus Bathyarchaeota archaeon]|nr:serine/threonine protein phosphatase [Candidatus Bathyarchaeota archaeon]